MDWSVTRVRNGDPARQQIQSACIDCNTLWMSGIQGRTSSIALPFVRGEFPYLREARRTQLATWATMVTMNLEYWDRETVQVPQVQRTALMRDLAPPPNWYVGITRYAGTRLDGAFYHRAMRVILDELDGPEAISDAHDAQATVFALGKTLFHTFSVSSAEGFSAAIEDPLTYGSAFGLRTIWPIDGGNIQAALHPYTDPDVANLLQGFGGDPVSI